MEIRGLYVLSRFAQLAFTSLIFVSALSGCSSSTSTAKLQLTMPDWQAEREAQSYINSKIQALSAPAGTTAKVQLSRVMVNITGPAAKTDRIVIWEDGGVYPSTQPADQLSFELEANAQALIQVLAITKIYYVTNGTNTAVGNSDEEIFYYGDATTVLKGGTQGVDINVAAVDFKGNGGDGAIAGRWMAAGKTNGPTSKVLIKYHPPTNPNKPMTVIETEMHGGWFNVMSLTNTKFSYWLEDGTELFPGIRSNADGLPVVNTTRALKAIMPASYENDGGSPRQKGLAYFVGGFFGDGYANDTSKEMCFSSTVGTIPERYTSSALSTLVPWMGATAPTGVQAGILQGGKSTGCATDPSTYFTSWLTLDHSRLRNASEAVLGFRGPFRWFVDNASTNVIAVSAASSNMTVKWSMLPGSTGSGRVTSVDVFSRVNTTSNSNNNGHLDYERDHGVACSSLTSLTSPFRRHGNVPVSAENSILSQNYSLTTSEMTAFNEGRLEVVVCAMSGNKYFNSGVVYSPSSGNSSSATALRVSYLDGQTATSSAARKDISTGVCTALAIDAVDASGNKGYIQSGRTLSIAIGGSSSLLYTDATCSNTGDATLTQSNFYGQARVFVKSNLTPSQPLQVNVSDATGGGSSLTSTSMFFLVKSKLSPAQVQIVAPSNAKAHACIPVVYQLIDMAGVPTDANSGDMSFSLPTASNSAFYGSNDCVGTPLAASGFLSSATSSSVNLFVKYTGTLPTLSFDLRGSPAAGPTPTYASRQITFTQPGAAVRLRLSMPNVMAVGSCQRIDVSLADANGDVAPNPTSSPISYVPTSSAGGQFFALQTECTMATPTTPSSIAGNATTASFYYRPTAAATGATFSVAASGFQSASMSNLTLTAPPVQKIVAAVSGETTDTVNWVNSGAPMAQKKNVPFIVTLYAVNTLNAVDTSYMGTVSDMNLTLDSSKLSVANLTWSSGVGTLTLMPLMTTQGTYLGFGSGATSLNPTSSSTIRILPAAEALKIHVPALVRNSYCFPVLVYTGDTMTETAVSSNTQVNVTLAADAFITYHDSYDCSTSSVTTTVIPAGETSKLVYAMSLGATPGTKNLSAAASGFSSGNANFNDVTGVVTAGSPSVLESSSATGNFLVGTCNPVVVTRFDSQYVPRYNASLPSQSVSASLPTGVNLYTDSSCNNSTSSSMIPALQSSKLLYFKSIITYSNPLSFDGLGSSSPRNMNVHY